MSRRGAPLVVRMFAPVLVAGLTLAACASPPEPSETVARNADGSLRVGALLSQTGDLAVFARPQIAAVQLAVDEINSAGGVNGAPVELTVRDDATDEQIASSQAQQLIASGVSAVVGSASSRITLAIIDALVSAGVVECSPGATSPVLSTYPDGGLFFRAVAPDQAQGRALAELVLRDGYKSASVVTINDAYGQGLGETFADSYRDGGGRVLQEVAYDPRGTDFNSDARRALRGDPQALVLIGLPETASKILASWRAAGRGPDAIPTYGAEGIQTETLPGLVDPDDPTAVDGLTGTGVPTPSGRFLDRLRPYLSDAGTLVYAPHAHDCMMLIALAAQAAGSNRSDAIANSIVQVATRGKKCTTFAGCRQLLDRGVDIDFQGESGPLDLTPGGEPATGRYQIWTFRDGRIGPRKPGS